MREISLISRGVGIIGLKGFKLAREQRAFYNPHHRPKVQIALGIQLIPDRDTVARSSLKSIEVF
jgi:hypothetical protein